MGLLRKHPERVQNGSNFAGSGGSSFAAGTERASDKNSEKVSDASLSSKMIDTKVFIEYITCTTNLN